LWPLSLFHDTSEQPVSAETNGGSERMIGL
jgi:hypothetical protein